MRLSHAPNFVWRLGGAGGALVGAWDWLSADGGRPAALWFTLCGILTYALATVMAERDYWRERATIFDTPLPGVDADAVLERHDTNDRPYWIPARPSPRQHRAMRQRASEFHVSAPSP